MNVTIAPDFEGILPRHTKEELQQLEANVIDDPDHRLFPPVIVWANHKSTILDGHNQYRIRTKHGLKVRFEKVSFETRDEAMAFAINVQLGRRNLDPSAMAMALSKLPKSKRGPKVSGQLSSNSNGASGERTGQLSGSVRETIAAAHGISAKSIQRADKVREHGAASVVKAAEAGSVSVSDAAAIADLPKPEQAAALKKVEKGQAKTLRQAAAEFDPAKLGDAEKPKKPKSGQPTVFAVDRKACLKSYGELCRGLNRCGIYDEFVPCLNQIGERLKQV